jgi:hypothetical protein
MNNLFRNSATLEHCPRLSAGGATAQLTQDQEQELIDLMLTIAANCQSQPIDPQLESFEMGLKRESISKLASAQVYM